jgi:WbqC-like protein family
MAGLLCAIRQPNFLPRLSTLAKLYAADIWIILDDVQFTRRDHQHRCYLALVPDARLPGRWLTLPVHLPGGRETLIRDTRLAEPARTAKRTSGILRHYHRRAPYRSEILDLIPGIEETITGTGRLADVSEHATIALLRLLNWPGATCRSSGILARAAAPNDWPTSPVPSVQPRTCAEREAAATSTRPPSPPWDSPSRCSPRRSTWPPFPPKTTAGYPS